MVHQYQALDLNKDGSIDICIHAIKKLIILLKFICTFDVFFCINKFTTNTAEQLNLKIFQKNVSVLVKHIHLAYLLLSSLSLELYMFDLKSDNRKYIFETFV